VSTAVNASNIASFLLLLGVSALEGTPRALQGACMAGSATLFGASILLRGHSPNYRPFRGGSRGAGGGTRRGTEMVMRVRRPIFPSPGQAAFLRCLGTRKLPARSVPPQAAPTTARPAVLGVLPPPPMRAHPLLYSRARSR
jgi:hypothetical protein